MPDVTRYATQGELGVWLHDSLDSRPVMALGYDVVEYTEGAVELHFAGQSREEIPTKAQIKAFNKAFEIALKKALDKLPNDSIKPIKIAILMPVNHKLNKQDDNLMRRMVDSAHWTGAAIDIDLTEEDVSVLKQKTDLDMNLIKSKCNITHYDSWGGEERSKRYKAQLDGLLTTVGCKESITPDNSTVVHPQRPTSATCGDHTAINLARHVGCQNIFDVPIESIDKANNDTNIRRLSDKSAKKKRIEMENGIYGLPTPFQKFIIWPLKRLFLGSLTEAALPVMERVIQPLKHFFVGTIADSIVTGMRRVFPQGSGAVAVSSGASHDAARSQADSWPELVLHESPTQSAVSEQEQSNFQGRMRTVSMSYSESDLPELDSPESESSEDSEIRPEALEKLHSMEEPSSQAMLSGREVSKGQASFSSKPPAQDHEQSKDKAPRKP